MYLSLQTAFHTSKEVYDAMKATIAELIRKPTLAVSQSFIGQSNGKSKLPDDMTDSVGQQLRLHFDEIDTDVIVGVSYPYIVTDIIVGVGYL